MVGFNVTCHNLGLWAGKASSKEGVPQEWVASAGSSPGRWDVAEGRLFLHQFLAWPPFFSWVVYPVAAASAILFGRRMSSRFLTLARCFGRQDSLEGIHQARDCPLS